MSGALALGLGVTVVTGCGSAASSGILDVAGATTASAQAAPVAPGSTPVLLIHGIFDNSSKMEPMDRYLGAHGFQSRYLINLVPNGGQAPLETLAAEVRQRVDQILADTGAPKIDIVAFSMGGVVSRYYLQDLDGLSRTRRFVTISSPHHGTMTAYAMNTPGAI